MITNTGCKKLRDLELNSGCGKCFKVNKFYEELISEQEITMRPDDQNHNIYLGDIDDFGAPELIRLTLDGNEYELSKRTQSNITYYGEVPILGYRWLTYKFSIEVNPNIGPRLIVSKNYSTGAANPHAIKIEEITKEIDSVSNEFRMAVQYVIDTQ